MYFPPCCTYFLSTLSSYDDHNDDFPVDDIYLRSSVIIIIASVSRPPTFTLSRVIRK